MKILLLVSLCFFTQTLVAQTKLPVAKEILETKQYAPVVRAGVRDAQIALQKQNAIDPNLKLQNDLYHLQELQDAAIKKIGPDTLVKTQLFNLGAEILPFVAPWINEIAKECMVQINAATSQNTEELAAACSQKAITEFQKKPAAFIEKLSPSDKTKLQALVDKRIKENVQIRKPSSP